VPSISDLDRAWGTLTNAVAVSAGTIAGNDLDARPIAQPDGDGCSFAIGQEVDNFVCLEVHQHSAVATATSPSPVVDAKNTRRWSFLQGRAARGKPEQGIRARRGRDPGCQARAGFTAERETEMMLKISEPPGAATAQARHICQTFRKCAASTLAIGAVKATSGHMNRHWPTLPREIVQQTSIPAVDPSRWRTAHRAIRRDGPRYGFDGDVLGSRQHPRHLE
jgi:hypothetical protein